ncbi:MAG: MFS transporter [Candidatus Lokiarchaeota archaeon]|nr:MFS transporter [Candidatus Lokiarchaeota archaeon]
MKMEEKIYQLSRGSKIFSLIILFLGWAITTANRQISDIIKKQIRLEFFGALEGYYTELSLIMDVSFWVFYIITALLVGMYSDKVGRKKIIFISLFLFTLTSIMTWLTPHRNLPFLVFARSLSGAAVGPFFPISVALIGELFEVKKRGKAIGTFVGGAAIGAMFGWVIAGLSVDFLNSWRLAFLFLSVPILIIGFISWIFLKESPLYVNKPKKINLKNDLESTNNKISSLKGLLSNKFLVIAISLAALDLFSLWVHDDWIATYLIDVYSFEETQAAIYRALSGIGGFLGIVLFGIISDKIGRKKALATSLLGLIVILLLFITLGPTIYLYGIYYLYIFSFFTGFFAIAEFAAVYNLVLENSSDYWFATAMGFVVFFGNGFALIGGPSASLLADLTFIGANAYLLVPIIAILIRIPLTLIAKDPAFATLPKSNIEIEETIN